MGPFSYIWSIYTLDTIDTRFTGDSKTPYAARIDPVKLDSKEDGPPQGVPVKRNSREEPIPQPSLWRTTEFYFYYLVFIVTVPYMFWIAYDVSRREYTSHIWGEY